MFPISLFLIISGYFQEAVVVLSSLEYYGTFKKILSCVAPSFFEHGVTALEAAWRNIFDWPSPRPGQVYQVPILGEVLKICLPLGSRDNRFVLNPSALHNGPALSLERAKSAEAFTKVSQRHVQSRGGQGFYSLPADFSTTPPGEEMEISTPIPIRALILILTVQEMKWNQNQSL